MAFFVKIDKQLKAILFQRSSVSHIKYRFCSLHEQPAVESLKNVDLVNKQNVRYQEYTPLGESERTGTLKLSVPYTTFKIMDYNILSHTHMMTHIRNYKSCPRECLNWDYRKTVLREEFLAEHPDIFCLQEVEGAHKSEFLKSWRNMGFDALYVPRGEGKPDGCAILYKTSLFRIADFVPVHFLRNEVLLLNRPNVGMVVKLELREHPGNYIVISNTHLLYNPRRVDIKLCQLQILLAETERVAYRAAGKYHPVVLTGDLNVNQDSGLISLLQDRVVDCNQMVNKRWRPVKSAAHTQFCLPADLLQSQLNIAQSCQYLDVLEAREEGLPDPRLTKNLKKILNQHRICPDIRLDDEAEVNDPGQPQTVLNKSQSLHKDVHTKAMKNEESPFSCLRHGFPFINVYDHPSLDKDDRKSENRHKRKLNVYDYMFYSSDSHKIRPGHLQLLSRLRLPSVSQYYKQIQYLPNFACGSDHLPLTATFLLPLQTR